MPPNSTNLPRKSVQQIAVGHIIKLFQKNVQNCPNILLFNLLTSEPLSTDIYPILDTRIFVHPFVLRHACTTPPEIWNGLDWRALVELRPPYIGKLRGLHFFSLFILLIYFCWKKVDCIFSHEDFCPSVHPFVCFSSVTLVLPPLKCKTGWTGDLWSNCVLLKLEN